MMCRLIAITSVACEARCKLDIGRGLGGVEDWDGNEEWFCGNYNLRDLSCWIEV